MRSGRPGSNLESVINASGRAKGVGMAVMPLSRSREVQHEVDCCPHVDILDLITAPGHDVKRVFVPPTLICSTARGAP